MTKNITVIVRNQKKKTSLVVHIPSSIAQSANLAEEQALKISSDGIVVIVHPKDFPQMTLEQRLDAFDAEKHAGEILSSPCIGAEML